MRFLSTKTLAASLFLCAGFGLSASAKAETIGPVITGSNTPGLYSQVDGDQNDGYILSTPFSGGGTVGNYTFYAAQGGTITPVLYDLVGGTFTVVGVGSTLPVEGPGVFTYSFGLTSGTDVTASNTYFGFVNTNGSDVAFDYTNDALPFGNSTPNGTNIVTYLEGTPGIALGSTYTPNGTTADNNVGGASYREYAINVSTVPAVSTIPEPSAFALLGTGLLGLVGAGRRKFFKA